MSGRVIGALYKKEITDILRDKKTILMMIIIPLVIYPLLFIGSMMLAQSVMKESTVQTYRVSFASDEARDDLMEYIREHQEERSYHFDFIAQEDVSVSEALEKLSIEAYITKEVVDGKPTYHICYNSSNNKSSTAAGMLGDMLADYNAMLRDDEITKLGYDPEILMHPIAISKDDFSSNEETMGMMLGTILPFMLIVSILMGAMYPAIDTTAGEKERGTLETLMTLPVKSIELIVSKFLATSSIAIGAALLNVLSMGILGGYFYTGISATSDTAVSFSLGAYIPALLLTLLGAVVFAMFASAVCLCFCIFAKSFKEAQNLTTPLMLVFLVAAMASIIPSFELKGALCYIPVVNLSLLVSELFSFHIEASVVTTVLLTNVAYSAVVIVIMTRLFCAEDVLFGDGAGSIRLIEKRSEMKKGQMPGIGDFVLLLALLLIIVLLVGSSLTVKFGLKGVGIQQLLIGFVPLFYAWYMKSDIKKLFSFKAPKVTGVLGGILLAIGMTILNIFLSALLVHVFPSSTESANDTMLALFDDTTFLGAALSIAVLPAICEELAFRGFLFGVLKHKYKPFIAIGVIGALFGAYHMNLVKFFVVGLLGGVIAYAVWKTGSIFVGMCIHFINNFTAVFVTYKAELCQKIFPILFKNNLVTTDYLLVGAIVVVTLVGGFILVNASNKSLKLGAKPEKL